MANAYKIKQVTLNGSGYFTALRASASTTLVKGIYFSHDDHNTTVTLALTKSGGTTTVLREVTHTADNMTQLLPDTIALESGDQLEVKSTHISSSDVGYMVVNYVESSTSVSAQSIDVLSDVDITTTAPTDGQVLVWNDSANEFRPGDAASGSGTVTSVGITAGTGISSSGGPVTTSGNITVALNADTHDLTDVTSTTPTTGQVLEYNGSYYTPSSKVKTLYDNLKTGSSTTINDGANTNSQMELTATTARLQTGVTEVKMTETSPGEIDFIVAAGAAGSETAFTAVEINGTTTANNALFDVKTGTRLRIESSTNDLATIRNQASADTVIDLPTSTGTLALTSELYTDADADGQIAAASVTDLSDVTSAGSGAIITSAERTKLTGIETGATADQTDAEIKTAYENNANTNAFTDAEQTKLSGIATGAEVNVQSDWNATSGDALILNKPTIPSNTNIANTDLTADNNRTLDMDANSLTIDINDGDFTLSDSNASDTYIQAASNVLTLGDGAMTVESDGIFQAKNGIEHDEANLTVLGDKGAGCEVTYMGSASTAVSQGRVYYYSGTTWTAYTPATEAPQKALLGIALGSTMAKGFLLKGFIHPDSGTLTAGTQVFGLTNGTVGTTAPSSGFQRILGHSISTSVIFFNPSQEYIDLA